MALFNSDRKEPNYKIRQIKKCPNCGAVVPLSKPKCPECGWEFDDVKPEQSALQKLTTELAKPSHLFSSRNEKKIIRSFHIPNTKEDLLEIILFFKAKSNLKHRHNCYTEKYREAMLIAKQYYDDDLDFKQLIQEYKVQVRNEKLRGCLIAVIIIFGILVLYSTLGTFLISLVH